QFSSGGHAIEGAKLVVELDGNLADPVGTIALSIQEVRLSQNEQSVQELFVSGVVSEGTASLTGRATLEGRASGATSADIRFDFDTGGKVNFHPSTVTVLPTLLRIGEDIHEEPAIRLHGEIKLDG